MSSVNEEFRRLFRHPLFWIVTFARCSGAFIIFINPFWGYFIYVILDIADGQILPNFAGMNPLAYHLWDKYVDTFVFFVMLIVTIPYGIFTPLLFLLLYRLVGQLIFWETKNDRYLLVFPNIFEIVWLWMIVGKQINLIQQLNHSQSISFLILLSVFKEFQELLVHLWGPKKIFPFFRNLTAEIFPWYARINYHLKNKKGSFRGTAPRSYSRRCGGESAR